MPPDDASNGHRMRAEVGCRELGLPGSLVGLVGEKDERQTGFVGQFDRSLEGERGQGMALIDFGADVGWLRGLDLGGP